MTTAHRPTWHNALGGEGQGGNKTVATAKVCAKDLPGQKALKFRRNDDSVSRKDQREALNRRELRTQQRTSSKAAHLSVVPEVTDNPFPEDADDEPNCPIASSDEESDEEAELLRELEKIKKEKEEEAKKKKEEEDKQLKEQQRDRILRGNPLLIGESNDTNATLKRRWDDEVVFKNQAKGMSKAKKTFINDTVRSEFHKKFLAKYIM